MRVFISWSGELSKRVAQIVHSALQDLFDGVEPWMSDVDIDSGARGLTEIHASLSESSFGVIVVTLENQSRPWLNYEAGSISRAIGNSDSRVVPLLVDIASPAQLSGPLSQFQARIFDSEGFERLVTSIAGQVNAQAERVQRRLSGLWDDIEKEISEAKAEFSSGSRGGGRPRPQNEVLDEILTHVRDLARVSDGRAALVSRRIREVRGPLQQLLRLGEDLMLSSDRSTSKSGLQVVRFVGSISRHLRIPLDSEKVVEQFLHEHGHKTSQEVKLNGDDIDSLQRELDSLGLKLISDAEDDSSVE